MILDLDSAKSKAFGLSGIINGFGPSPDGQFILISMIQKPFSYLVPHGRFPFNVAIYSTKGILIRQLADIPLSENIPKGFGATRKGPRSFNWRNDVPATLYWVEAQDDGDPKKEVPIRDILYCLKAPFDGQQKEQISFPLRYGGITWGDGDLALAYEWQWANRQEVTNTWKPDHPKKSKKILFDRSWEDRYNNPGSFSVKRNQYGRGVLRKDADGKTFYLIGAGASPEGNKPFIDQFDIETKKTTRLWQSEAPYYEYAIRILDEQEGLFMTRRESKKIQPNFFFRNFNTKENKQITFFKNPYEVLKGVEKQLIKYKRADGVELTGELYLPANYNAKKDGPLPVIMWAYPKEYKSSDAAGQVQNSPYEFLRLYSGSPIYWVTQGYAVFDDFGMPIIGEGEEEPNETFVQQLVAGAKAAIDKLDEMGVGDPKRVAVGGHSYGAFMTANLLAHSDLFAAGIARSGAYNRTLTPFGFQSEERTLWETPDTYVKMSPFMFADKIKTPLLMIHGEADNNSGTYPMQSKRFYNALKGHGATVRLVMLPHESHGYRARESVMHMLWETHCWLEKYVKNREV